MERLKKFVFFLFSLTLIGMAIGLFYIQNFYLPELERSQRVNIYVSTKTLDPLTQVSRNQFEARSIPREALLPDFVTNLHLVEGKQINSTLFEGEVLTHSRISEVKIDPTKNLLTTIVPEFFDDINTGDLINVYVLKAKKDCEIFTVETVFLAKKVEKVTREDYPRETNAGKKVGFSVLVDEDELMRYYAAQHGGQILTVKIANPNILNIVSSLTTFDPNEIVFQLSPPTEEEDQ